MNLHLKIFEETVVSIPLETISSQRKNQECQTSSKLKYSNSSYIVVQDKMLMAEMTDRINEMVIYEESSVSEISVELVRGKCLVAIAEETSTLIGNEDRLEKNPTGHSLKNVRSFKNCQPTNTVSLNRLIKPYCISTYTNFSINFN